MERKHFTEFYRKNVERIYRYLYFRVAGNKELAQDLTQDVFLKAFEAFERYDQNISVSSWIFTIARHHLLNHVAKQRPNVTLEEIENTLWDHDDLGKRVERRYDDQRLLDALKMLPPQDAELLRRKHLEGWSYDQIAEETGKTSAALRVRSHRALKDLRKILRQP